MHAEANKRQVNGWQWFFNSKARIINKTKTKIRIAKGARTYIASEKRRCGEFSADSLYRLHNVIDVHCAANK